MLDLIVNDLGYNCQAQPKPKLAGLVLLPVKLSENTLALAEVEPSWLHSCICVVNKIIFEDSVALPSVHSFINVL